MNVLEIVGEEISSQRARIGVSLEQAARTAGIDTDRLAAAEAGEIALEETELGRLADAYGVDVTAFFGGRITPVQYLFGA